MKKTRIKDILTGTIIGITLTSIIGVSALVSTGTLNFTPKDSTWNVNTAQDALDSLYDTSLAGKNNIISALNSKGLSLNNNSSFESIVSGINSLKVGGYGGVATVNAWNSSYTNYSSATLKSGLYTYMVLAMHGADKQTSYASIAVNGSAIVSIDSNCTSGCTGYGNRFYKAGTYRLGSDSTVTVSAYGGNAAGAAIFIRVGD